MDNLKKYFDEHRDAISDEIMPEGDEQMFLDRLADSCLTDASREMAVAAEAGCSETESGSNVDARPYCPEEHVQERRRIRFHSAVQRKNRPFWRVALIPVAASLAMIFMVQLALRPVLTRTGDGSLRVDGVISGKLTAVAVYEQYTQEISDLTRSIALLTMDMNKGEADYVMNTVENITRENVSLIDLLPAELDEAGKISVLREYAVRRIGALEDYKTRVENLIAERI